MIKSVLDKSHKFYLSNSLISFRRTKLKPKNLFMLIIND